jgi:alpha-beta hydrolase superfamily lysophospholipase
MLPRTPSVRIRAPHDGVSLALYRAPGPVSEAAARVQGGIVLLVHGLGEHAGRYQETAAVFRRWGYQVWALDQRGHGQSAGARGGLPTPDALLQDLAAALRHVRREEAGGPLVLLGHSMGGAVCARLMAERGAGMADPGLADVVRGVDRLILSSPALALGLSSWMASVVGLMRRVVPGLALSNGLKVQGISRDPEVVRAYRADPLVHTRITPALAGFLLDAGVAVRARAAAWTVPTLVLWSGADQLVDPAGSARFVEAAPAEWVKGIGYPELYHEILNEPERGIVFRAMAEWLGVADPE